MILPTKPGKDEDQGGSVIITVMMFVFVFAVIGIALFFLLKSSTADAALERRDVKAFNVAEAGVDAGMVALRAAWPREDGDSASIDKTDFRGHFDTTQFPDPSPDSQGHTRDFIHVEMYDDTPDNPTSAEDKRVPYDSNLNDIMWIDSEALVDNVRHRILVQVQRLKWHLDLPEGIALAAKTAGGNGQGLSVTMDPNYHGPGGIVDYTGKGSFNKDVNPGANIQVNARSDFAFSDHIPDSLLGVLQELAKDAKPGAGWDAGWNDSYFDDTEKGKYGSAAANVSAFLSSKDAAPGSIVYFKTAKSTIEIAGNTEMGTPTNPVILVVDAKAATNPVIDWRGTAQFHGVLIVVGDVLLRGTQDCIGCVFSSGGVENKGGPGIKYNGDYIRRLNAWHTLSVAIVPNTWEEYTVAK